MNSDIPGLGGQREGREEALALLYQANISRESVADVLADRDISPSDYAIELAEGVDSSQAELDVIIGSYLTNWTVERMPLLDRLIARMATWELANRADIPTGVVLSEAVEIATMYCAEPSPRFLNGVLGSVAGKLRRGS